MSWRLSSFIQWDNTQNPMGNQTPRGRGAPNPLRGINGPISIGLRVLSHCIKPGENPAQIQSPKSLRRWRHGGWFAGTTLPGKPKPL
ncbi:hypothetical protein DRN87_01880 [Candidatus Geothermarchaeota archaeon]|nr:MAG: hypothetical protein DRN87_01880 [Candidatus Geothermarchaeota archaeon]